MRKRSHRKPRSGSPFFERAYAKLAAGKAATDFNSQAMTARLKVLCLPHGVDATDMLATIAVVVGTPCECGSRIHGRESAWVRQLHGALRAVKTMCLEGYRWDSAQAASIDRAIELAIVSRPEFDVPTFLAAWMEARGLAEAILRHEFTADQIS